MTLHRVKLLNNLSACGGALGETQGKLEIGVERNIGFNQLKIGKDRRVGQCVKK